MKFSRKHAMCEGVNTFFGKSNAYTRARMMGQFHAMGMVGEIARTSRRVVFLNRRFVFPTRRLVFSNRRVVKPTPGFVKPTPGLVTPIRRNFFLPFWPSICRNCATQRHSICKEQSAAVILQRHQTNSHYSSHRSFILR
ncbi:MAG: hypothetical protein MR605_04815, partial [Bacteroidales bacterium]|nr:hypothetical protein [Bacteroidales bacterium]